MPKLEAQLKAKLSVFKHNINRLPQERSIKDTTKTKEVRSYRDILSDTDKTRQFADYKTQIKALSKFCHISDTEFCRQKLREVTYFRLKGYALALRETVSRYPMQNPYLV